ncbi:MAG: PfkB family carbohydrate kinase, partial [Oscillospiraceae bacterium]
ARFVITLGKRGVKYYDGEKTYYNRTYNVKAVDTTGAGDTFTGYFMAGFIKGKPSQEIIATAAKAAAMSVTKKGATESIPTIDEVECAPLELSSVSL